MSKSSSAGDLVPKDITEVLALQASKKKRGSSLGRAFSWFKSSKRKRSLSNGQSRSGGPCRRSEENTTAKQSHASGEASKAGQKQDEQRKLTVHYTASQHYQENVFIEGSRPQYLEDLHTEAQEGLKILQQEEHKNGGDFQDDHIVPEEDTSSKERDESLETDSTAGQSVISGSTVSAVSSRPVLTRQGSTFKPLNPVKRPEKTKRRSRRTTIMGIPQQVQKELDMARSTILQYPNRRHDSEDDSSGTVVIPTIDGELPSVNHEGARVHLQNIEVLQASRDEEFLINHIHSVYQDELNRKLGLGPCSAQRPKSLAVPGMTTCSFLYEPQGPVMSISPQATYLSKIIPNAILPAAIDIIEINHDHSRRSASIVSKSSLASASPASSRSASGTNQGPPTASPSRSHSQSSETIISNSSTISSKERCLPTFVADRTKEVSDLIPKDKSVTSSSSWKSSDKKGTNHRMDHKRCGDTVDRNSQSFSRSLSVIKTKLPPAPPQRTNSLHHEKLKRRSRERIDMKDVKDMALHAGKTDSSAKENHQPTNNEKNTIRSSVLSSSRDFQSSVKCSPLSPDQTFTGSHVGLSNSSPQKTGESGENKFDRTLSPSSGYSSQSGTPTHSPKEVSPSSPGKRGIKPLKPDRAGIKASPAVSVSSSMTSLSSVTSDMNHQDIQTTTTPSEPIKCSPPLTTVKNKVTPTHPTTGIRELFNIPPPPKIKAPSPPPPETWIHNKQTVELLCGPGPNLHMLHQLQNQQKEPLIGKNLKINSTQITEQMFRNSLTTDEIKTGTQLENKENVSISLQAYDQMMTELPNVRQNGSSTLHNELERPETLEVERTVEGQTLSTTAIPTIKVDPSMLSQTNCEVKTNADILSTTPTTPRNDEINQENQRNGIVIDILNHKPMQTLGVEVPEVNGISPPPSPPPEHQPPPPPTKKMSASSSTILLSNEEKRNQETEEQVTFLESSWPPPPPPMEESTDSVFEEQDDLDFPPPPPSFIQEPILEKSANCHGGSRGQQTNTELMSSKDMDSSSDSETQAIQQKRYVQNGMDDMLQERPSDNFVLVDNAMQNTTEASPKMPFVLPNELVHGDEMPTLSAQDLSEQASPDTQRDSTNVPLAPPLPVEEQSTVNFRKKLSLVNKDSRSKELLCRHKSTPIPKEDANIPLVTPSLLQMVRLRSVNVGEDQVNSDSKPSTEATTTEDHSIINQTTPQKPIRKSLSLKSSSPAKSSPASATGPSMCLQEAIRMKTAAMSSSGVPAVLRLSSASSSHKTPDGCDLHKSPASTASFIFSKSTKKVVIETPTSPEVQASLQQSLAAEIMQVSDQAKTIITNGTKKSIKVPPPVAKKPVHGTNSPNAAPDKTEILTNKQIMRVEVNGQNDQVLPAGQRAQSLGSQEQARNTETAC